MQSHGILWNWHLALLLELYRGVFSIGPIPMYLTELCAPQRCQRQLAAVPSVCSSPWDEPCLRWRGPAANGPISTPDKERARKRADTRIVSHSPWRTESLGAAFTKAIKTSGRHWRKARLIPALR